VSHLLDTFPVVTVIETHVDPDGWDDALAETEGPQLVVGGPGSGKTEFLVRRALHLIVDRAVPPDAILLLSFSRRGAADLRQRLIRRLDRSFTRIQAITFHALALRIIEAYGPAGGWPTVPTPLTGPEQVALVAEVLAGEEPAAWPLPYRPLLTSRSFAAEVADFCLRAAERLIGPQQIAGLDRADWRGLPGFQRRYRQALVERGRIDYGSLHTEALRLLAIPSVCDAVGDAARYLLVDEYQDTTVAQAALLEALVGASGNLTAAGDPYQSVYSFRGSELANVAGFVDRFPGTPQTPARRIVLTTSFRVPARILDAAVRVTAGVGLPGAAGVVTPAPGDGSVVTHRFDQLSHEADWIASEIQRLNLVDRIAFGRIALLVRSKRGILTELSRALDRRRIPHDRPDDRLAEHPAVRPVLDLVTAAVTRSSERAAALRRVLLGPLVGLPLAVARDLERRRVRGESWTAILADDPALVAVGTLIDDTTWATDARAADGFWHVWTTLSGFARLVADPSAAEGRAALTSFAQALERLGDRDPSATLADHLTATATEDFEAEPLIGYKGLDADEVTLTTLHQAKGLDFDVVFIADAREGVLPDLRHRDSILGARHLSPSHGGDDASYARFRLQEEMRLIYTAMCRARLRVILTCTSTGSEAGGGAPSRVFPLVTGRSMEEAAQPPSGGHDPVTPLEAESWLRRMVRDPRRPAAERLAALAALTDDASWHPRPRTEFAGVLRRGSDRGVIRPSPTLSPSQAESYRTCPRRYVFERPLRIGAAGSQYASLGRLVHEVLEEVEGAAGARGEDHGTLIEALATLDARFDPAEFGGDPWASWWKERARRILEHLYEQWPGRGPGIALEHEVARTIDGVPWVGSIDRLERRDDGVWVIDYKTGTGIPTTAEAAASLQLGFYVGAIDGHDVAGAESWYPATQTRSVTRRSFDMATVPAVDDGLRAVQQGILAEDWTPRPGGHCERCDHRIVCPAWPEGAEAYSA
jgi:superfamily I DNA/RNA helicase/RecB family exonuclease